MTKGNADEGAEKALRYSTMQIADHDTLVERLPEILRRLNENPQIALLSLVNPLLALEDVGVTLSPELEDHVKKTLGFPRALVRKTLETRRKVERQLAGLGRSGEALEIPTSPRKRAELVFDRLGVSPKGERPDTLTVEELWEYRGEHPLVHDLLELGRLERGAITYETRGTYEAHKAGRPHHPWLKSLHFRKGG